MGSDSPAQVAVPVAAPTGTDFALAPAAPLQPLARLVGVGLVVFLANAAMLALQLVAGRLLTPFIGSTLETWTAIIGVFLTGIALGNGFGGRIADRYPTPRTLAVLLALGAIAAVWMAIFPQLLTASGVYKSLPLGPRIPLLALVLCLPVALVLSLLTPLAIKLCLPDLSQTGRVAGMVFALSTLGCLIGNYLTGFVLLPAFTINSIVFVAAGSLLALGAASLFVVGKQDSGEAAADPLQFQDASPLATPTHASDDPSANGQGTVAPASEAIATSSTNPYAFTDIRLAFLIVFLASFGGMSLELTASRELARHLGVSLFTWTGVIGVMLAGTALGNFSGGILADWVNRSPRGQPRNALAGSLLLAGAATVFQFVMEGLLSQHDLFADYDPILKVIGWTFCIFFLPMFALGTISPQVIRLAVPDVEHVGRVAGRVYAWSTAGAIVGTFSTGYLLISALGVNHTLIVVALILALMSLLVANVWSYSPLLYVFSIVLGGITGGLVLTYRTDARDDDLVVRHETNYYTILVTKEKGGYEDAAGNWHVYNTGRWHLTLDHLIHSSLDPQDPLYLYYTHEYVQAEFVRAALRDGPNPRVLVIGGGGYTFPRYMMETLPATRMDVVEIDPGVTWVAKNYLGLKDYNGLSIHHMDGRQYVTERVPRETYDLVVQDAVNDLSVPSHLLTREYNDAVKATLKPNGVYLLTVIDSIGYGQLWKAAMNTLALTYPSENVVLLDAEPCPSDPVKRQWFANARRVYVIYASDRPFDLAALRDAVGPALHTDQPAWLAAFGFAAAATEMHRVPRTHQVPRDLVQPYLDAPPRIVLTDQFAPVDNLMADEFRYRDKPRP